MALQSNRWLGGSLAVALGALAALLSSAPMPRGPVTDAQGIAVIVGSLAVGLVAGYLMRSAWAMLLTPLAYVVTYELARLGIEGASLEGFRFDSVYGIAAFVAGRGFHGLLALLTMAAGASLGAAIASRGAARRSGPRRLLANVPRGGWLLATLGLAVLVALPASTPPILGADGRPLPGSIAELTSVGLGGTDQAIMVRAADPEKPVLLYLSGGPGQSDLAYSRVLLEPLVHDFVVVTWDQRGTGRSYGALDPTSDLTLQQAVDDTIELSEHLRARSTSAPSTCSASRGDRRSGCSLPTSDPTSTTPTSALGRW